MGRLAILTAFLVPVFLFGFASGGRCAGIPAPLVPYIDKLNSVTEFRDIVPIDPVNPLADNPSGPSKRISRDAALQDLEYFRYLWKNAYAGAIYWERNGVRFDDSYQGLAKFLKDVSGEIEVVDFEQRLAGLLAGVQDGHLLIEGADRHGFYRRCNALFTDILVEDRGGVHIVQRSRLSTVPVGSIYRGPDGNLFRTLSGTGSKQYLLGILTADDPPVTLEAEFSVDGTVRRIACPLHHCRAEAADMALRKGFALEKIDGRDVLHIKDLDLADDETAADLEKAGHTLRGSDALVVNLVDNMGGNSSYYANFLNALNDSVVTDVFFARLQSPPVLQSWMNFFAMNGQDDTAEAYREMVAGMQEMPIISWEIDSDQDGESSSAAGHGKPSFGGRCVVLMNRRTSSSGEDAALFTKRSLKSATLIGENTYGIVNFGDRLYYRLKNSGIHVAFPSMVSPGLKEGKGLLPDFWLDSSRPLDECLNWMKDPDHYQFEFEDTTAYRDVFFRQILNLPDFFEFFRGHLAGHPDEVIPFGDVSFSEWNNGRPEGVHVIQLSPRNADGRPQELAKGKGPREEDGPALLLVTPERSPATCSMLCNMLPDDVRNARVRYSLKLDRQPSASSMTDFVFIGFHYTTHDGATAYVGRDYSESREWSEGSAEIDLALLQGKDCGFFVFSNFAGEFRLDNLRFELTR